MIGEIFISMKKKEFQVTFGSTALTINTNFALFLTLNCKDEVGIPGPLKEFFRPFYVQRTDTRVILTELLQTAGFLDAGLPDSVLYLMELLPTQIRSKNLHLNLCLLRLIIREAVDMRLNSTQDEDRKLFLLAMNKVIQPFLNSEDKYIYNSVVNNIFGISPIVNKNDKMKSHIDMFMKIYNFQSTPKLVDNVIDLFEVCSQWRGVAVLGKDLSGRNTTLSAVKYLSARMSQKHVLTKKVYPSAFSLEHLYGFYSVDQVNKLVHFKQGVIPLQIKEFMAESPSAIDEETGKNNIIYNEKLIERWMIFDGNLNNHWVELLVSAFDPQQNWIILPNFEKYKLPPNLRFLFFTEDLSSLSPSTITKLGKTEIEYQFTWIEFLTKEFEELFEKLTVADTGADVLLKEMSSRSLKCLFQAKTPKFKMVYEMSPIEIVKNFMVLLKFLIVSFFKNFFDREEHLKNLAKYLSHMVYYSMIIGVGHLMETPDRVLFEGWVKDKMQEVKIGDKTGFFEKGFNFNTYLTDFSKNFLEQEAVDYSIKNDHFTSTNLMFHVYSPGDVNLINLISEMMKVKINLMILGTRNSGKDAYFKKVTPELERSGFTHSVHFSMDIHTQPETLISRLKSGLMQKSKKLYGARVKNGAIVVLDDINLPYADQTGEIKVLELLRYVLNEESYVDVHEGEKIKLEDMSFVCKCNYRLKHKDAVNKRLSKRFFILPLADDTASQVKSTIYHTIESSLKTEFREGSIFSVLATNAADIFWSVFQLLPKRNEVYKIPTSQLSYGKLYSMVQEVCLVEKIETERNLYHLILNVLFSNLSHLSEYSDFKNELREGMRSIMSRVKADYDFTNNRITKFPLAIIPNRDNLKAILRPDLNENDSKFTEGLDHSILSLKNLSQTGYFLLYTEAYEYFFKLVRMLLLPDVQVMLVGSPGRGKLQLASLASRYLDRSLHQLEFGSEHVQYQEVVNQVSIIFERCFIDCKSAVIYVKLREVKDSRVLAFLKEIIEYHYFNDLTYNLIKIKESIPNNKMEIDDEEYIRNCFRRYIKFIFCEDCTNQAGPEESNSHASTNEFLMKRCFLIYISEWTDSSLKMTAMKRLDGYEDLNLAKDEKEKISQILIDCYNEAKKIAEESAREYGQELLYGPFSFLSICENLCATLVKARIEVKDAILTYQNGISRFKMLSKILDDLNQLEDALVPDIEKNRVELKNRMKVIETETKEYEDNQA
jgi:hypothetical protein